MKAILYLGFNNPLKYKRGVENVIVVQAAAISNLRKLYFCFDNRTFVFRWNDIIGIAIKKDLFWPIRFVSIYIKFITKYKNIVIHSHNFLMGAIIPSKLDFCTVHDGLSYQFRMKGKHFIFVYRLVEFFNYLKCKKIHFVSEFSRNNAIGSHFLAKTTIIYNSTPLEFIVSDTFSNSVSFSERSKPRKVLVVRSIEERALIDLVISVATCLSPLDYFFTIAGKGPLLDFYEREVSKLELAHVEFRGFVDDSELVNLYKHSDLVMVPAAYGEGFGLPVIEGYLFNKPVISSNVCALPEVIYSKDYLFDNTVDSVLQLLGKDELFSNKLALREYYFKRFGSEKIIGQYKLLYGS